MLSECVPVSGQPVGQDRSGRLRPNNDVGVATLRSSQSGKQSCGCGQVERPFLMKQKGPSKDLYQHG